MLTNYTSVRNSILLKSEGTLKSFVIFFRAMINELTHKEGERVALNSYRYAWTVVSNIFVYSMASVLLGFQTCKDKTDITPADAHIFRTLTFIVIGFGFICMIIFHVGIKESKLPSEETEYRVQLFLNSGGRLERMTWKRFLRKKEFYQCALIWMFARVILNVTQVRKRLEVILRNIFKFSIGRVSSIHVSQNVSSVY